MDIHRCRFVPFKAAAINAVAFSHPHLSTGSKHSNTVTARLAIGRANGDIEIWNPLQGTWLHETTIAGGHDRSVEGLAWVVGDDEELDDGSRTGRTVLSHGRLRLFSIGYTNTITEWDLERACAKRHASGQHGELWCLATQPKPAAGSSSATQRLVGGTMDGCLALYTTEDDDLRFQRLCRTPKKTVKIVSIAFQTRQLAVAGCSDGTIRVFDVRNGAVLHAMTMGRDLAAGTGPGAKDVIVWSVRCLPSGDIVSGDSTGQICIWDGATYTQAQRIQSHTQDVLSLATSADGATIVSGGMDRRVVLYREMAGKASRWARVWHRRYHQHDVKALAAFEAKGMSVVVAGGPDAAPVVLPLQKSGMEHHRTLSHLPQTVPVASAPGARLVICWWERRVEIWAFDAPLDQLLDEAAELEAADLERNRHLAGRILLQGEGNIVAAAISADGALVVVATATDVKAFQLRKKSPAGELVISKVPVPTAAAAKGASGVAVSPDGRWVCLARGVDNHVTVLEVVRPEEAVGGDGSADAAKKPAKLSFRPKPSRLARLRRSVPRHELFSGLGRYDRRVTQIAFSPDSSMLATSDLAGYIDTWVLRGPDGAAAGEGQGTDEAAEGEDGETGDADAEESSDSSSDEDSDADGEDETIDNTNTNKWVRNPRAKQLPKLSAAPVVLSFAPDVPGAPSVAGGDASTTTTTPARDYVLLAATATSRIFAFNPLRARLVPWQRRLSPANLPAEYRDIRDVAKGVLWQGPRAWIYGATFLFMVDTSVDSVPSTSAPGTSGTSASALTQTKEPAKRKRKRGDDTGAGNRMAQGRSLGPQRVQMAVEKEGGGGSEWVDVDMEDAEDNKAGEDGDDDDDETDSEAEADIPSQPQPQLQSQPQQKSPRKQRKQQPQQAEADADADSELLQLQLQLQPAAAPHQQPQQPPPRWWHTFKYRPILGVVPLASSPSSLSSSSAAASSAASHASSPSSTYPPLEVALIERPGWDMDLPERYGGDER